MKHKGVIIGASILCVATLATGTVFAAGNGRAPVTVPDSYEAGAVMTKTDLPETQFGLSVFAGGVDSAMSLMRDFTSFYGDYFEENKDKTLSELREAWEAARTEEKTFDFRSGDGHMSMVIHGIPAILFNSEFYEQNKDKTLAEAKEIWLAEAKALVEEAAVEEKMTRETADAILAALESGDVRSILEAIGNRHSFKERGGLNFEIGPGMGGFFSGDYYEQNKDKTLKELRDEWLDEMKAKLDEAVASGDVTQEQADEIYDSAQQGGGLGFGFGGRIGGKAPGFERSIEEAQDTATSIIKRL